MTLVLLGIKIIESLLAFLCEHSGNNKSFAQHKIKIQDETQILASAFINSATFGSK